MSISSSSGSDFVDFSFLSFLGVLEVSSWCSRFRYLGFSVEGGGSLEISIEGGGSKVFSFLPFFSFFSFLLDFSFDRSFFRFSGFTSSIIDCCQEKTFAVKIPLFNPIIYWLAPGCHFGCSDISVDPPPSFPHTPR